MKELKSNEEIIDELLDITQVLVTLFQSYDLKVPESTLKRLIEITQTFRRLNTEEQQVKAE